MNALPIIETERLILREIEVKDANDMYEYAHLPNVGPVAGWSPHRSVNETEIIIQLYRDKKKYGQLGVYAIILKENNKMIGTLELHTYTKGFKAELGYTVSPKYCNIGIATEAAKEALDWGFIGLGLKRIECTMFVNNISSKRVCEKLGFTYEGLKKCGYLLYDGSIHDILCYGMTVDEYLDYYFDGKFSS